MPCNVTLPGSSGFTMNTSIIPQVAVADGGNRKLLVSDDPEYVKKVHVPVSGTPQILSLGNFSLTANVKFKLRIYLWHVRADAHVSGIAPADQVNQSCRLKIMGRITTGGIAQVQRHRYKADIRGDFNVGLTGLCLAKGHLTQDLDTYTGGAASIGNTAVEVAGHDLPYFALPDISKQNRNFVGAVHEIDLLPQFTNSNLCIWIAMVKTGGTVPANTDPQAIALGAGARGQWSSAGVYTPVGNGTPITVGPKQGWNFSIAMAHRNGAEVKLFPGDSYPPGNVNKRSTTDTGLYGVDVTLEFYALHQETKPRLVYSAVSCHQDNGLKPGNGPREYFPGCKFGGSVQGMMLSSQPFSGITPSLDKKQGISICPAGQKAYAGGWTVITHRFAVAGGYCTPGELQIFSKPA